MSWATMVKLAMAVLVIVIVPGSSVIAIGHKTVDLSGLTISCFSVGELNLLSGEDKLVETKEIVASEFLDFDVPNKTVTGYRESGEKLEEKIIFVGRDTLITTFASDDESVEIAYAFDGAAKYQLAYIATGGVFFKYYNCGDKADDLKLLHFPSFPHK